MRVLVLPSVLAADFGCLAAEARKAETAGADALHLDIMDGHFVPNLTMGPDIVEALRRAVSIPLSVHLMLEKPHEYIQSFREAGADSLLIHVEARTDVARTLEEIRRLGARAGLTLNPETDAGAAYQFIGLCDELLCMTVHPGYGGQQFMPQVLPKILAIRQFAEAGRLKPDILVDGGIDAGTASACARNGANAFIAGTALFRAPDMERAIADLRLSAGQGMPDQFSQCHDSGRRESECGQ